MPTKDELEFEQNEARFKNALDKLSVQRYYERDLKKAFEEGIQLGRAFVRMVILVDKIRLLQQILKRPLTPAEDLRPRSEAELLQLSTDLEHQALSR